MEDFTQQINNTKKFLKNYYEKQTMYELNEQEINFKRQLEIEHEEEKNPTVLGSLIQNISNFFFSNIKNTKVETFIQNFTVNDQFITEYEEIQKNENFKIKKSNEKVIMNEMIKIKHL
eukprot:gene11779-5116_t